jgi:hypothetical protein
MKPTQLGRAPTFSKTAFAYSGARISINALEISPVISFPLCSTKCSNPSQSISLSCDWCFPKTPHCLSTFQVKCSNCNAIFHSRVVNFSRNRLFHISTPTFYSWSNNTIHPRKHIGKLLPSTDLSPPPLEWAFKALLSIVCVVQKQQNHLTVA